MSKSKTKTTSRRMFKYVDDNPPSKPLEEKGGVVQATKADASKNMLGLTPVRAREEVGEVFTYGARKYSIGNWHSGDGFNWGRLMDASARHQLAFEKGEDLDPESGRHHLAHKICCDMMLLEHCLTNHGRDDRAERQYLPDHAKKVEALYAKLHPHLSPKK